VLGGPLLRKYFGEQNGLDNWGGNWSPEDSGTAQFLLARGHVGMIRTKSLAAALGAAALFSSLSTTAGAQPPGFAVDRFDPSERGSDWFVLESLDFRGHLRPAAGMVVEYGYRPLAIYNGDGTVRSNLVQDSLVLHPGASLVLWDQLRVGFDL